MDYRTPLLMSDSAAAYQKKRKAQPGDPHFTDPYFTIVRSASSGRIEVYEPGKLKEKLFQTLSDTVIGIAFTEHEATDLILKELGVNVRLPEKEQ